MSERDSTEIERKMMGKFPREVQDLVLHLVNTEGIKWRNLPQDHLALYPPDGVSRPFKISASRPAEQQCRYIERQFMAEYGIKGPDGTVPGFKKEEAEVAASEVERGIWGPEGETAEAVRTLAAALGVSLGGTVSEEEYLAVVAEKDACQERAVMLSQSLESVKQEGDGLEMALADMTAQRDHLLDQITRIAEITTEAQ